MTILFTKYAIGAEEEAESQAMQHDIAPWGSPVCALELVHRQRIKEFVRDVDGG